jgi:hypothetical protein
MTSLYYVACVECGKRFMSAHNEHGRLWCSVGCQFAEEDAMIAQPTPIVWENLFRALTARDKATRSEHCPYANVEGCTEHPPTIRLVMTTSGFGVWEIDEVCPAHHIRFPARGANGEEKPSLWHAEWMVDVMDTLLNPAYDRALVERLLDRVRVAEQRRAEGHDVLAYGRNHI